MPRGRVVKCQEGAEYKARGKMPKGRVVKYQEGAEVKCPEGAYLECFFNKNRRFTIITF